MSVSLVVTDSTCLIGLERIDYLELLPKLYNPIIIPPAVEREFGSLPKWIKVEKPNNQAFVATLKLLVDDGESEAIALAYEQKSLIILDDRQARSVAKHLKLNIIGTIGILIKAKHSGLISLLKPLLEDLERNNFYFGTKLKEEALRLVEE